MEEIKTHVFTNGLPTVYIYSPGVKTFTVGLVVGAGTRFETQENEGLSRFYANVCFQGSQQYPDKKQLWQAIDELGLTIKPAVYPEYSLYYYSCTKDRFSASLDLVIKTLYSPALTDSGLDAEKKLSLAEIKISNLNPQLKSVNMLTSMVFNNTSLGYDALGTEQSIQAVTNQALQDFKSKYYVAQNSLLLILGPEKDFDLATLNNAVQVIPSGARADFPAFNFTQTKTVQEKISQQGKVSYLTFASLAFGRNSDKRIAQNILLNLLSEGRNNQRLKTLQRKRMVSFVRPWIKTFSDCGLFLIQAACPSNKENEVLQEMQNQIGSLAQGSITQQELDIAKAYYENKLELGLSNSLEQVLFYTISFFFNLPEQSPEEIMDKVKKVSVAEINDLAKTIFRSDVLSWVIVGPGY